MCAGYGLRVMASSYRKTVTYRLAQAAKAQRMRSGTHLARIGLHPGQDLVLKSLAEADGQTMSQLALTLAVQPPTVTKMITRLAAHGLVERQASDEDGRLARAFLTDEGRRLVGDVDRLWKSVEKEALAGIDDKDRKRLRRLLRTVEKNLAAANGAKDRGEDEVEEVAEVV